MHSAKAPRSAEARWPRHESPRAVVTEIDLARGRDVEVGVGVHFHSGVKPLRGGAAVLGRVHREFRGAPRIIEMDRQQIADPDFLLAKVGGTCLECAGADAADDRKHHRLNAIVGIEPQQVRRHLVANALDDLLGSARDLRILALHRRLDGRISLMAKLNQFATRGFAIGVGVVTQALDSRLHLLRHLIRKMQAKLDVADITDGNGQLAVSCRHIQAFLQDGHAHLAAVQETHFDLIAVRLISWLRLPDDQSDGQRRCEQQREAKNSRHVRLQGRSDGAREKYRPPAFPGASASLSRASRAATSYFLVALRGNQ